MTAEPGIAEAGYLARGRRRAILGALAALRVDGAIGVARPGAIKQKRSPPSWADPVTRAVYRSLSVPGGMRMIRARTAVQKALAALRADLVAKGLVLPVWCRLLLPSVLGGASIALFPLLPWEAAGAALLAVGALRWPRRTWEGRRVVRKLRAEYPADDETETLDAWRTGMIVALHGRLDLPNIAAFARKARLRDGGVWPDHSAGDARNTGDHWAQGGGNDHARP